MLLNCNQLLREREQEGPDDSDEQVNDFRVVKYVAGEGSVPARNTEDDVLGPWDPAELDQGDADLEESCSKELDEMDGDPGESDSTEVMDAKSELESELEGCRQRLLSLLCREPPSDGARS